VRGSPGSGDSAYKHATEAAECATDRCASDSTRYRASAESTGSADNRTDFASNKTADNTDLDPIPWVIFGLNLTPPLVPGARS